MSWSPTDYQFQPYELQAQRLPSSAGAPNSESGKRKGGRQRRSSILCQVDGCGIELINEKTYYKRYRICITHCNMKSMVIQGRRQRFCQQCGRFHDVTEFEGARKSCRRKLERHNQRRRTVPAKGCAWQSDSEEDEVDLTEDAEYQALANMKRGGRSRSARLKGLDAPSPSNTRSLATESPSCSLDRRYSSMDLDNSAQNIAGFVPLTDTQQAGGSSAALKDLQQQQPLSSSDGAAVTQDGLPLGDGAGSARNSPDVRLRAGLPGSTNATRVLPFPSSNATTTAAGAGLAAPDPTPFTAMKDVPFFSDLDDDILGGLLMFPDDISDSMVVSKHDQFRGGADGSVAIEHHAAATGFGAAAPAGAAAQARDWLNADFAALGEFATATSPRQAALETAPGLNSLHHHHHHHHPLAAPAPAPTALEAASSMVTLDAPALVGYSADGSMTRLSIKLFNCTPDMLAPQVKSELTSLLRVAEQSLVEGYIRPGCMHVTLSLRVPATQAAINNNNGSGVTADATQGGPSSLVAAVEKLLQQDSFNAQAKESMLVQLHDELVVVKQNKIMAAIDMGKSLGLLPQINAVRPLAVLAAGHGTGRTAIKLAGRRLNGPSSLIMCRQGGRNLTIELPDDEDDENETVVAHQVIGIGVLGLAAGCAEVEVQVGSFLGPARPFVVLTNSAAVEEIRQLESADAVNSGLAKNLPVDSFLRDLGLVSQYLDRENADEEGRPVPNYTPELLNTIQNIACKLVAAAVSRKWIALTTYLLPATTAGGQSLAEAVIAMDAACPHGSTLLHVAVGTGNVDIVHELAEWAAGLPSSPTTAASRAAAAAASAGPFAVNAKGLGGVTPLHVAAMLPPKLCYAMRVELTSMSSATPKLWGLAQSDDGITPEGLADMVAGGGRSSGSGLTSIRATVPTPYMKPTPFSNVSSKTTEIGIGGQAPLLDSVLEKSGSFSSLPEATPLSRILSWKSRTDVKAHFVDRHIGNMMDEVDSLREDSHTVSSTAWHVGAAVGSVMALALGTAAMALHLS